MELGEYYEAYPDTRCPGGGHAIKHRGDLKTLALCVEACDSTPGCIAFAVLKDWRDGCWLKGEGCVEAMEVDPERIVYLKPSKFFKTVFGEYGCFFGVTVLEMSNHGFQNQCSL